MPQIIKRQSTPGSGTTSNAIAGEIFERLGGRPAAVRLYMVSTDGAVGDIQFDFTIGSDIVVRAGNVNVRTTGPQIPDDQVGYGEGLPGDPLGLRIVNTNAAARLVQFILDIQNL